jgi:hypothetical protein
LARTDETSPRPLLHGGCRGKRSRRGSPAGSRGTMMPNKPNCPKRDTEAVSRSRPADRIPSIPLFYHFTIPVRCRWCKTNPIPGRAGWDEARGAWGAVAPNKANSRRASFIGPCLAGRPLIPAKQTQFDPTGAPSRAKCEKQTQSAPVGKGSVGQAPPYRQDPPRQTKPIPGERASSGPT